MNAKSVARALPVLMLVAVVHLPIVAWAEETELGRLSNPGSRISWSQTIESRETQVFLLDLQLPADEWERPGGVFVGVHWPGSQSNLPCMRLRVFPPFGLLRSVINCGDAVSLRLPSPANGPYRLEVVSHHHEQLSYQGLAMVQHDNPTGGDLLPDLTPLEPDRVLFPQFFASGIGSCRHVELDVAKRCLRFDLAPANLGEGPLEIHIQDVDTDSGEARAVQRTYRGDGTSWDHDAGTLSFHAVHGHFHFDNAWRAELWESDDTGARTKLVRTGSKSGFGFCDVLNPWFGQRRTAAFRYDCESLPDLTLGGSSAGWTDVYPYNIPGNYVEVSEVRDGSYVLRLVADPDNKLLEIDETNNAICQPIAMTSQVETNFKTGPAHAC